MAALFEANRNKIADRIKGAEQMILKGGRELYAATPNSTEQGHISNALHALHALPARLGV